MVIVNMKSQKFLNLNNHEIKGDGTNPIPLEILQKGW